MATAWLPHGYRMATAWVAAICLGMMLADSSAATCPNLECKGFGPDEECPSETGGCDFGGCWVPGKANYRVNTNQTMLCGACGSPCWLTAYRLHIITLDDCDNDQMWGQTAANGRDSEVWDNCTSEIQVGSLNLTTCLYDNWTYYSVCTGNKSCGQWDCP